MAKSIVGTLAKIATKRAMSTAAKRASADARAASPLPAMAIGLVTSMLTRRLLPVKIAGIGGILLASFITKIVLDKQDSGRSENPIPAKKLPVRARKAPKARPAKP
jgi:hypothetical protein